MQYLRNQWSEFLKLFNPDTSLYPTVYNESTAPLHYRVKQALMKITMSAAWYGALPCPIWAFLETSTIPEAGEIETGNVGPLSK